MAWQNPNRRAGDRWRGELAIEQEAAENRERARQRMPARDRDDDGDSSYSSGACSGSDKENYMRDIWIGELGGRRTRLGENPEHTNRWQI